MLTCCCHFQLAVICLCAAHYISMWTKRLLDVNVVVDNPRRICFNDHTDEERVEEIFDVALQIELPGVDERSVARVHENIKSGRFTHEHYVKMFGKRLTEAGVTVCYTAEETEADTKKRQKEYKARVEAENERAEKVKQERMRILKEAEDGVRNAELEEADFITERRRKLEAMDAEWEMANYAGAENEAATDSETDSDYEEDSGAGIGLSAGKGKKGKGKKGKK